MGRLNGKFVIVTGGAGAIGSACAELAALEGAHVIVADLNEEGALAVMRRLQGEGYSADACAMDLGEERSLRALFDTVAARWGGVDALVNNAAALNLVRRDSGVEKMDVAVWDETMRINLRGTMLACQLAIPLMRSRGVARSSIFHPDRHYGAAVRFRLMLRASRRSSRLASRSPRSTATKGSAAMPCVPG